MLGFLIKGYFESKDKTQLYEVIVNGGLQLHPRRWPLTGSRCIIASYNIARQLIPQTWKEAL